MRQRSAVVWCAGIRLGKACSGVELLEPVLAMMAPDLLHQITYHSNDDSSCRWTTVDLGKTLKKFVAGDDRPSAALNQLCAAASFDHKPFILLDLQRCALLLLQPASHYGEQHSWRLEAPVQATLL